MLTNADNSYAIDGGEVAMGFLSDVEAGSLRLARLSLHLVGGDGEFEPQPELPVEHDDFLLALLRDIAADSVYRFEEESNTKRLVEEISSRRSAFEEGAQRLAADFCRFHRGQAKDGAFFVFELGVEDQSVKLYGLVKYDYNEALEIVQKEGMPGLRRIVEAFIANRSAIQKSALIRTRNGVAELGVSTRDRMGRPAPVLTEFFKGYLQVTRDRTDEELTRSAKEVIRSALIDHREFLPAGGLAAAAARANAVLRDAAEINEEVVQHAVWVGAGQPVDDRTKERLSSSVTRLLKRTKLAGVAFAPVANVLQRHGKRTINTREGIKIEYDTALEGQAVVVQQIAKGRTRFVITTEGYTDDIAVDRTGRQG